MKKIVASLLIVGFLFIIVSTLNKINYIKIYTISDGEKTDEKIYKEKKDIKEITGYIKNANISKEQINTTSPEYQIKTITAEYNVWMKNRKVLFVDTRRPNQAYEIKEIEEMEHFIK